MEIWTDGQADAVSRALTLWFNAAATPLASTNHESIQGVTHFISNPIDEHGLTSCAIDLGTAPVEAVILLLGYLSLAGAGHVDLGELQDHERPPGELVRLPGR
jgi:hypothetical protein